MPTDLSKAWIPLGAGLAIMWVVMQITYGAGGKVASSEGQMASVIARVEALEKSRDEVRASMDRLRTDQEHAIGEDHDRLITLKAQVDRMLDDKQPIQLNVSDPSKK